MSELDGRIQEFPSTQERMSLSEDRKIMREQRSEERRVGKEC